MRGFKAGGCLCHLDRICVAGEKMPIGHKCSVGPGSKLLLEVGVGRSDVGQGERGEGDD